jgi:hypothetical protein
MRARRILACLALLIVGSAVRAAAVAVSPVAVYLDHRERQGTITLFNPGIRPEEVQIEFGFGYPISDERGEVTVPVQPQAPAGEPSAVPWLRAFPQRVRLEPGQRQVVRVMARPPADLPVGEYWARALIRSRGGVAPIEEQRGDVAVQIDVETVVVVAVNYRNGDVRTGLEVLAARAEVDGASDRAAASASAAEARLTGPAAARPAPPPSTTVEATIDLRRTGNAAFLGRLLVELVDADDRVVGRAEEVLAVYRDLRRRIRVTADAGSRPVRARFVVDTERDDLPPGGALPGERTVVEIPVR